MRQELSDYQSKIVYIMYSKLLIIVFSAYCLAAAINSQCCQQWKEGQCVECPQGMHLFRYNCIFDIPNCIEYQGGFDCRQCQLNYRLLNGQCTHPRYNIDIKSVGNFTPFLKGAIKPDPLLLQAREELDRLDLWVDWYNYSALQNRTFLSKTALTSRAESLQHKLLNTTGTKLHFICKTNYSVSNTQLTLYRLTYQLANNTGYADLFFAVEAKGNQATYVEIMGLRFSQLEGTGWKQLSQSAQQGLGQMMGRYFLGLLEEDVLRGYWKQTEGAYNLTLFYLDRNQGLVPYTYIAYQQDLDSLNITQLSDQNSSDTAVDTNIDLTENNNQNKSAAAEPSSSSSSPLNEHNASIVNPNPPFIPYNDSTSANATANSTANSTASNSSLLEEWVPVSELSIDPIFATGYAVSIQQGYVSASAKVQALSTYPNGSKCIYFSSQSGGPPFVKMVFHLQISNSKFTIESFQESNQSLVYPVQNKDSTTVTNTSVSNTSSNSSTDTNSKSTVKNDTKTKVEPNSNPSQTTSSIPEIKIPGNATVCSALEQRIDITGQMQSDLFLPRINLLLTDMYSDTLTNCVINSASYEWLLGDSALLQTIRYYITYTCNKEQTYSFVAEIKNNELQLLTKPQNIKENGLNNIAQDINATTTTQSNIQTKTSITTTPTINTTTPTIDTTPSTTTPNPSTTTTTTTTSQTDNAKSSSNSTSDKKSNTTDSSPGKSNNDSNSPSSKEADKAASTVIGPNIVIIDNTRISNQTQPTSNSTNIINNVNSNKITNNVNSTNNIISNSNTTSTNASNPQRPTADSSPTTNTTSYPTPPVVQPNSTKVDKSPKPPINKTVVPQSEYTSDPKYKSVIEIVKSIKRLPANVTLDQMNTWKNNEDYQYFSLTFLMAYLKPLPQGYTHKEFYFDVEITPNNFITIINESSQMVIKSSGPKTVTSSKQSPSSSSPFLPSNFLISNLLASPREPSSGKVSEVGAILQAHNPSLTSLNFSLVSTSKRSTDFGGLRSTMSQILRYSSATSHYCYRVDYNAIEMEGYREVELVGYRLTNCSSQDSNIFVKDLQDIQFKNASSDPQVDKRLQTIANKEDFQVHQYSAFGNIYKISYEWEGRECEVAIDNATTLVLFYRQGPDVIFTPLKSRISPSQSRLLNDQIQKYLGKAVLKMFYLEQTKTKGPDLLLQAYVQEQKLLQWGIEMENVYVLQMVSNKNGIKVVGEKKIKESIGNNNLTIDYYGLQNHQRAQWGQLLKGSEFPTIMKQLQSVYPSFIKNCKVLSVLAASVADWLSFWNQTYSEGIQLKLVLNKKYSQVFSADYVITVEYTPNKMLTSIKAVEALPSTFIILSHCLKGNSEGLPTCMECQPGFILNEGECIVEVPNCLSNYFGFCLECQQGPPMNDLSCCERNQEVKERWMSVAKYFSLGSVGK